MKIKNVETKIGHEAERIYTSLAKKHKEHELIGRYYFFKRFKTVLYNKNNKDKINRKETLRYGYGTYIRERNA